MNYLSSLRCIRSLSLLAGSIVIGLAVIACSGSSEEPASSPTATAPAASPTVAMPTSTPEPSATTTPEPTATPEPEPTPVPPTPVPPTQTPAGGGSTGGTGGGSSSVRVTAQLLAFSPRSIVVPANTQVTITLQNNDTAVAHDIQIAGLASTETCLGPCTRSVSFNSGAPRTYSFMCSVHPTMTGDLTVQ